MCWVSEFKALILMDYFDRAGRGQQPFQDAARPNVKKFDIFRRGQGPIKLRPPLHGDPLPRVGPRMRRCVRYTMPPTRLASQW